MTVSTFISLFITHSKQLSNDYTNKGGKSFNSSSESLSTDNTSISDSISESEESTTVSGDSTTEPSS